MLTTHLLYYTHLCYWITFKPLLRSTGHYGLRMPLRLPCRGFTNTAPPPLFGYIWIFLRAVTLLHRSVCPGYARLHSRLHYTRAPPHYPFGYAALSTGPAQHTASFSSRALQFIHRTFSAWIAAAFLLPTHVPPIFGLLAGFWVAAPFVATLVHLALVCTAHRYKRCCRAAPHRKFSHIPCGYCSRQLHLRFAHHNALTEVYALPHRTVTTFRSSRFVTRSLCAPFTPRTLVTPHCVTALPFSSLQHRRAVLWRLHNAYLRTLPYFATHHCYCVGPPQLRFERYRLPRHRYLPRTVTTLFRTPVASFAGYAHRFIFSFRTRMACVCTGCRAVLLVYHAHAACLRRAVDSLTHCYVHTGFLSSTLTTLRYSHVSLLPCSPFVVVERELCCCCYWKIVIQ